MAGINPFQAPINYAVEVQSPFEAALGGFKIGAAGAEAQAQAQAREQAMKGQTELKTLLTNPNATAADYERVIPFLPKDQAAIVTQGFERKTKEQQQNSLQQSGQVYTALKSGQTDIAKNLLKDQATAFRNAGREQDAKATETYLQLIDMNPTGAQTTIGLMMATLPGGKEILENVDKTLSTSRAEAKQPYEMIKLTSEAIIKEQEAKFAPDQFLNDLNLTKEQISQAKAARRASDAAAAKSGADAKRAQAEANQILSGIVPADKRPELEGKMRKEYNEQTKPYQEVKSAYSRLLSSEDNAVGDLSLIFGYMKMLDSGSVVREGEFATAQNATGVPERIKNIYNKVVSGEHLNKSQRESFKSQAKGLYNSALESEKTVRTGLERIAKGYGLNTQNIFYSATEQCRCKTCPSRSESNSQRHRSSRQAPRARKQDAQGIQRADQAVSGSQVCLRSPALV
jgi:hypothetical protein